MAACASAEPPPQASATNPEATSRPAASEKAESKTQRTHRGDASFYADHFEGKPMANGEPFSQNSDSAASKTLPLGTRAEVKNLENGRTATVTIEDRGPYVGGRVIDLSKKSAERLDMVEDGTAPVEVKPLPNNTRK